MAQLLQGRSSENALRLLNKELLFLHTLEYASQVLNVRRQIGTINQYVIKENNNNFAKVRREEIVHGCLKRGWSIREPKGHDRKS